MKNLIAAFAAVFVFIACEKKEPAGNLHITGNIEGLKSGTLYIQELRDTTLVILDSLKIDGEESFESHLTITSPQMLYLFLDRGATNTIDNNLMFFAEPGNINISTTLDNFYAKAKITGSKNNDLYEEFKKVDSRFAGQQLDLIDSKLKAFQGQKEYSDEDHQIKSDAIKKRRYLYAINFAINNKDHEVAPYIALSEIRDANLKFLDTINKSLTPKVAGSKYGKMLKSYIAERGATESVQE